MMPLLIRLHFLSLQTVRRQRRKTLRKKCQLFCGEQSIAQGICRMVGCSVGTRDVGKEAPTNLPMLNLHGQIAVTPAAFITISGKGQRGPVKMEAPRHHESIPVKNPLN